MKELLQSDLGKIAANLKYEDRWTRAKLGIRVKNWIWDTMLMAHVLDNRSRITGLKFQAFVQLGQQSYDDHIKPMLKAKRGNALNNIRKIELAQLLRYNAMDAKIEWDLAMIQMEKLGIK